MRQQANTGKCPIKSNDTIVVCTYSDGFTTINDNMAKDYLWTLSGDEYDITNYRILTPEREWGP
jgi:hypothetical protein